MIMTHVDLIEKLLKYGTIIEIRRCPLIANQSLRYTPDGRNEKKQRLNESA